MVRVAMLMLRAALYLSCLPLVLGNVKLGKHIVKYTEATCLQATRVLCHCFPRVVPDESRNFMKLHTFWGESFFCLWLGEWKVSLQMLFQKAAY